jgi:hypothetical protein
MARSRADTAVLVTLVLCGLVPLLLILWIVIHF